MFTSEVFTKCTENVNLRPLHNGNGCAVCWTWQFNPSHLQETTLNCRGLRVWRDRCCHLITSSSSFLESVAKQNRRRANSSPDQLSHSALSSCIEGTKRTRQCKQVHYTLLNSQDIKTVLTPPPHSSQIINCRRDCTPSFCPAPLQTIKSISPA